MQMIFSVGHAVITNFTQLNKKYQTHEARPRTNN